MELTLEERVAAKLSLITGETITSTDFRVTDCVESATNIGLRKRYPFGYTAEEAAEFSVSYSDWLYRAAVEIDNRTGIEGETSHSENGINRGFDNSSISIGLLNEIVSKAKVL